jgi:hypothetical protein
MQLHARKPRRCRSHRFFARPRASGKLGLAGNSGAVPGWHEIFVGDVKLIGPAANRAQTRLNKATGKLDTRQLYHAADVVLPDGKKTRQITLDLRDKDQIPKIIQRERQRHNLPPLSDEQLAIAAQQFTVTTIENPVVQVSLEFSFAYLRHAMIKIAYELAFLWLGESYLDDPTAAELRAAIVDPDLVSTDKIPGYVGDAQTCPPFNNFWTPHEAHHLAYTSIIAGDVLTSVRVFDLYAAVVAVSKEPGRYFRKPADSTKLRFLAIDSVTGKTINTTFADESRRLAMAMTENGRKPPFLDPLSPS